MFNLIVYTFVLTASIAAPLEIPMFAGEYKSRDACQKAGERITQALPKTKVRFDCLPKDD